MKKSQLKNDIIKAVKEIFEEALERNKEFGENDKKGKNPLVISENDLTCHLFMKLYNPPERMISTEVRIYKTNRRHDMAIFDEPEVGNKCKCFYEKSRYGNPDEWYCKKFLAIIEIKNNWFYPPSAVKKNLQEDLDSLKEEKKISELLFMIYFDYKGTLDKKGGKGKLDKQNLIGIMKKYSGIHTIYGDLKYGKLYHIWCPKKNCYIRNLL